MPLHNHLLFCPYAFVLVWAGPDYRCVARALWPGNVEASKAAYTHCINAPAPPSGIEAFVHWASLALAFWCVWVLVPLVGRCVAVPKPCANSYIRLRKGKMRRAKPPRQQKANNSS